ncbi:MAG: hypothetical protein ACF8PN_12820 [Phycisphaerales bacterium]
MRTSRLAITALAGFGLSAAAWAQSTPVDGSITPGEYGPALWLNEDNPTGFGDNNDPSNGGANGSEMDGVYAFIGTDFFGDPVLFIGVTGNLETNFNKIEIFLDTIPGVGQNQLRGDNPDVDFNGLNRMGDDLDTPEVEGLRFDHEFTANMWIGITTGNYDPDLDVAENYYNFADLDLQFGAYLGTNLTGDPDGLIVGDNPVAARGMILNSNIDGVTDTTAGAGLAGPVDTGIEFSIPLDSIGNPDDDILMTVFINGQGHDFVSSQMSGGHPYGAENFGEPRTLDLQCVAGDQFVTVENQIPRQQEFVLQVSPLVAGGRATLQAESATPGETVYFAYSLRGFGSTPVPQLGVVLDLDNPQLAGTARANANGNANFSSNIPPQASGRTVYLQAAEQGRVTNAVACPIE